MVAEPFQVMPPLSADEYEALKSDIALRGVMVPVEYDEHGAILDGHHRVQICAELGVTHWPRLIRYGLSEDEKRRHARRLNLDRRHLDQAQRRSLIAEELRDQPEASDRAIASGLGVHHSTVGEVRGQLEATGQISQSDRRTGKDGKARRIVQYVDPTPEGIKGTKLSAKAINEAERASYRTGSRDLGRALSDMSAALNPAGRKFPVVYADPAWSRKAGFGNRAYENHYGTMRWNDIIAMPVARRVLPDAWLFLWIPRAHLLALHPTEIKTDRGLATVNLPLAYAVARAWGFDAYSTCFVWTKTDEAAPDAHGTGLIAWDQDEILCLFKRGRGLAMPSGEEKYGSNHREPAGKHSAKPTFYRDMINRMTAGVPVLELFAREDDEHVLPPNFYTWGNQSKNTADAPVTESGEQIAHDPDIGECADDGKPEAEPALINNALPENSALVNLDAEPEDLDIPAFLDRRAKVEAHP